MRAGLLSANSLRRFVIGRVGADLCLTSGDIPHLQPLRGLKISLSGYVSRKHAQFQRTALGWRVLDTSTNGLCVNGVRLSQVLVSRLKGVLDQSEESAAL
mmetsp:Transcript_50720/g.158466  ORF Transcript_50720/g.158466 Transcript_50720/m.158466 type:complete len:100 (+) Transcript_50720:1415-1714(+)